MACYEPFKAIRYRQTDKEFGTVKLCGKFIPENDLEDLKKGRIITIPCGKCIGCRLDYARHWADRLILEYKANPKAVFVTLTYNNDHLPVREKEGVYYSTLVKKHVSRFIKNLRSRKEFKDTAVRFFASGEYGEKLHRCHYHLIIFGFDLDYLKEVSELIYRGHNELKQIYWQCPLLDSIWTSPRLEKVDGEWKYVYEPLGFVQVSETSYETMSYVARYSLKKAKGDMWTADKPIEKEFSLMSRMPGIGYPFIEMNPGIIDEVEVLHHRGKEIYWPRYLIEKYYGHDTLIEAPDGWHICHWYDDAHLDRKLRKMKIQVDSLDSKYSVDKRSSYDIMSTELLYKESAIKALKREDL